MPEQYDGTTPDAISAQARALDVPSVNVKRDGVVRKGAKRRRHPRRDGPPRRQLASTESNQLQLWVRDEQR